MRLNVKVVTRASRDQVLDWAGDTLRVAVRAAPEKGRANSAVVRLLAEALGLPRSQVGVVVGHASPKKLIQIEGIAMDEALRRLGR